MPTAHLSLSAIKAAYEATIGLGATPHRNPHWENIDKALAASGADPDPLCKVSMLFLEGHNTGYDGLLHRYMVTTDDPRVEFWVDLAPETLPEE